MRKLSFTILFALICTSSLTAQNGWILQTQIDTSEGFLSIKFNNSAFGYISGRNGAALITTNSGNNWVLSATNVSNNILSLLFLNDNTGYGCGTNGLVLKTTNQGMNWVTYNQGFSESLWSISFFDINTGFITGDVGKIRVTTNSGNNWSYPLTPPLSYDYRCSYILNNVAYISKYKSTNRGLDWFAYNGMLIDATGMKIFTDSIWYGCSSGGHFVKTTDGGQNWYDNSFSNNPLWALSFVDTGTGYVAGVNGVYKTTNAGLNWDLVYSNPNYSFRSVYAINKDTVYAVGFNTTTFNGILVKTTTGGSPIGIQPISNYIPKEYYLEQNYPNPFNPSTNIKFDIRKTSFVMLHVYDVTGRLIHTLVNEELNAGSYQVDFDGTNLSSGIYYYKLLTVDFAVTKKMVLLK